jgi:hypothetical protein
MVTQISNAHNYTGDMMAKEHLYQRTEALLSFLDEWKLPLRSTTLTERVSRLVGRDTRGDASSFPL